MCGSGMDRNAGPGVLFWSGSNHVRIGVRVYGIFCERVSFYDGRGADFLGAGLKGSADRILSPEK